MTTHTWGRGGLAALLLLTSVELLVFLEVSIVNVALPAISASLVLSQAGLVWIVNAYQLTFGGLQLVAGRLADLAGRRRLFQIGLAVFTAASALAGLAGDATTLLVARGLQGVGAAIVVPAQLALIAAIFTEPAVYRRAMGVWSAMAATGAASGVVLGGVLTEAFGWPSVFWINVPVGVVALLLSGRLLPADRPRADAGTGLRDIDVTGGLAVTVGLLATVYVASELGTRGLDTAVSTAAVLAVAMAVVFTLTQRHARMPVVPRGLLARPAVRGGTVASLLVGAVHVPAFVLLTLVLQQVLGYSIAGAGFAVLPIAAMNLVIARTAVPWALGRYGPRVLLAVGMALMAAGLAGYAVLLSPGAGFASAVLLPGLLFAAGLPAVFVGATTPAVRAAPDDQTGAASGLVNTAQRVGAAVGVTGLLLAAQAWTSAAGGGPAALADGLRIGMAGAATLAVVGVVCALALVPREAPVATAARR